MTTLSVAPARLGRAGDDSDQGKGPARGCEASSEGRDFRYGPLPPPGRGVERAERPVGQLVHPLRHLDGSRSHEPERRQRKALGRPRGGPSSPGRRLGGASPARAECSAPGLALATGGPFGRPWVGRWGEGPPGRRGRAESGRDRHGWQADATTEWPRGVRSPAAARRRARAPRAAAAPREARSRRPRSAAGRHSADRRGRQARKGRSSRAGAAGAGAAGAARPGRREPVLDAFFLRD